MKKDLKSIGFLFLCFGLGAGLSEAFIHLRHPSTAIPNPPRTGLGDAPTLRGFFFSDLSHPKALDGVVPLHATAVAMPYPADSRPLSAAIAYAHSLGLKVLLLPPAKISEKNPFPRPLSDIAAEAQADHADLLCISWLDSDPDPEYWQPLIAQVRKNFTGHLILAATPDYLPGIEFWSKVDYLGAIGSFQLPIRIPNLTHPLTLQDLRTAWASSLDSIESLSHRYGTKAILFDLPGPTPETLATQSNFIPLNYEALVTETKGRDATDGLFLGWNPNPANSDSTLVNPYPDLLIHIAELWSPNAAPRPPAATLPDTDTDDTDP